MNEWIKCSERMPEMLGTYIVCGKMKYSFEKEYEYFADVAEYAPHDDNVTNSDAWQTWNDWYEGQDEYEIVAWMEMPEPLIDVALEGEK